MFERLILYKPVLRTVYYQSKQLKWWLKESLSKVVKHLQVLCDAIVHACHLNTNYNVSPIQTMIQVTDSYRMILHGVDKEINVELNIIVIGGQGRAGRAGQGGAGQTDVRTPCKRRANTVTSPSSLKISLRFHGVLWILTTPCSHSGNAARCDRIFIFVSISCVRDTTSILILAVPQLSCTTHI